MAERQYNFELDPFKSLRKNAHIWRGENAILWYNETIEGGFSLMIFYERGGEKRYLRLEVDEKNRAVNFDNKTLPPEKWDALLEEVEFVEKMLKPQKKTHTIGLFRRKDGTFFQKLIPIEKKKRNKKQN